MPNFYYEAIDEANQIMSGEKVASNEEEVASFLKQKKYTIININENKKTGFGLRSLIPATGASVSLMEKADFARNLATMIKSGMPIAEAIGIISEDTKSTSFRKILEEIKYNLESGRPLSQALTKYPQVFDKIFISLVAAGEMSGTMPEVLTNLHVLFTKNIRLRNKIISAFTYPIVVLIALAVMGIAMLILVVPKLIEVFSRMKVDLPFALKFLNFLSLLFIKYWFITFPVLAIIVILIILFFKSEHGKKFQSYLLLKIPLLSKLTKYYDMARLTSTLSLLMKAGVPMTDSLKIVSESVLDTNIKEAILDVEKQIKEGRPLSEALSTHPKEIPKMLISISKVGERTGKIDEVLAELGKYYNDQVDFTLKTISDLIEPILMLIVGIIVGILVISIIAPIYSIVGNFSGK